MKKTIISLAVAAGMAASSAAFADATVYGNLHLSLDDKDTGAANEDINMNNQTSAIGVKGSDDLGGGMKAFFKAEWQVDPSERNDHFGVVDRDQYIGIKGGMGTVKFGTMSSNFKQMGGKVDPMYRTALEGRGMMQTQSSALHGGAGRDRGRMTDTLQYSSPKMGGMQLVINTTFDDAQHTGGVNAGQDIDETLGVGFRYAAKSFSVYVDYIDMENDSAASSETATKIGGTFNAGPVKLGLQLEQTEDLVGSDYTMVSADYSIDKNNSVYATFGQRDDFAGISDTGSTSFAVMYNHNMSKNTNLYVGYGKRSDDDLVGTDDVKITTAGMRVKF